MPIYEYKCAQCGAVSNHLARSFSAELHPVCPRCQGADMTRLISRPAPIRVQGGDRPAGGDAGVGEADYSANDVAKYARMLRDDPGPVMTPEMRDALDQLAGDFGSAGGERGDELWGSSGDSAAEA
jgi:putative FmdB family regulatory protein